MRFSFYEAYRVYSNESLFWFLLSVPFVFTAFLVWLWTGTAWGVVPTLALFLVGFAKIVKGGFSA